MLQVKGNLFICPLSWTVVSLTYFFIRSLHMFLIQFQKYLVLVLVVVIVIIIVSNALSDNTNISTHFEVHGAS